MVREARAKRQRQQLGMSHGSAVHHLRKTILFSLVQELNRDVCHVCNNKIDTAKEFSIEHILPWEGRDEALFWDLTNIAFSHMKCNRPHVAGSGPKPKHFVQKGYAWCRHHECEHPIEEFSMRTAYGKVKPRVDCKRGRVERKQLGLSN